MSYAVAAIGTVTAGAAIYGAISSSNSASDAVDAQKEGAANAAQAQLSGTQQSIAAQKEMTDKAAAVMQKQYDQSRADLQPFMQSQLAALGQANALTDPNNPLYQQERQYSTQAIQRQLSSQGLLRSKKQVDLLSNLELGLNQERYSRISALAGTGAVQSAAGMSQALGSQLGGLYGNLGAGIGSAYQNSGANLASIYQGRGNAIAQGAITQGQISSGLANSLSGIAQGTYGNYLSGQQAAQQQQFQQRLLFQLGSQGGGMSTLPAASYGGGYGNVG